MKSNAFPTQIKKRPSRSECLDIVNKLYLKHENSQIDYAKLFLYFRPTVASKKPKNMWEWVSSVAPTKHVNYDLIQVTSDYIAATDGLRLHIAPNFDNIYPGYYCPRTSDFLYDLDDIGKNATFPEIQRYIDDMTGNVSHVAESVNPVKINNETAYEIQPTGLLISATHFDDAMSLSNADSKHLIKLGPGFVLIDFSDGRKAFVVTKQKESK